MGLAGGVCVDNAKSQDWRTKSCQEEANAAGEKDMPRVFDIVLARKQDMFQLLPRSLHGLSKGSVSSAFPTHMFPSLSVCTVPRKRNILMVTLVTFHQLPSIRLPVTDVTRYFQLLRTARLLPNAPVVNTSDAILVRLQDPARSSLNRIQNY